MTMILSRYLNLIRNHLYLYALSKAAIFLSVISVCMILLASAQSTAGENKQQESRLVASGKGIEIKQDDVIRMEAFLEENTPFRIPQGELARYTLKMKIFAQEALQKGLAGEEWKAYQTSDPKEIFVFSDVYIEYLMDNYELDESVIVSYYRSFPERFLKDPESDEVKERLRERGYIPEDWLEPLDEVRQDIRAVILRNKQRQIREDAFNELKEKYEATIH